MGGWRGGRRRKGEEERLARGGRGGGGGGEACQEGEEEEGEDGEDEGEDRLARGSQARPGGGTGHERTCQEVCAEQISPSLFNLRFTVFSLIRSLGFISLLLARNAEKSRDVLAGLSGWGALLIPQ